MRELPLGWARHETHARIIDHASSRVRPPFCALTAVVTNSRAQSDGQGGTRGPFMTITETEQVLRPRSQYQSTATDAMAATSSPFVIAGPPPLPDPSTRP